MSVRDASESGPPAEEEKVGFVARLRRRLKRGAKDTDVDAADAAAAAPAAEEAGRTGSQDSDVEAEEAELYARRPLVRAKPAFAF